MTYVCLLLQPVNLRQIIADALVLLPADSADERQEQGRDEPDQNAHDDTELLQGIAEHSRATTHWTTSVLLSAWRGSCARGQTRGTSSRLAVACPGKARQGKGREAKRPVILLSATHRLIFTALTRVEVAEDCSADEQRQAVGLSQSDVHQKEHEVLLVVPPNAVVDPRAVVVHALDAEVARRAVMHPLQLVVEALTADRDHAALAPLDDALLGELLVRDDVARHHAGAGRHARDVRCRREERDAGERGEYDPTHLQVGAGGQQVDQRTPKRSARVRRERD